MNLSDKVSVTVHSLLYIINKLGGKGDFHKIFKILYFAERDHLAKYGSSITENNYIAMNNGPVPSLAYDILKSLKGNGLLNSYKDSFTPYFELKNHYTVESKKNPDLDELSESEIKCLDDSVNKYGKKSFSILTDLSHDSAWNSANRDSEMNTIKIAKSGGASKQMITYIKELTELKNLSFS